MSEDNLDTAKGNPDIDQSILYTIVTLLVLTYIREHVNNTEKHKCVHHLVSEHKHLLGLEPDHVI